jgi:hypothetical protein
VSPLFGAAFGGGTGHFQAGVVYRLTPPSSGQTDWRQSVIYNFCAAADCSDGATPSSGLLLDELGNLYGTTSQSGAGFHGGGTVFELSRNADRSWTFTLLHTFCEQTTSCKGGYDPFGQMTLDSTGNLYGLTAGGGTGGKGTAFRIKLNGASSTLKVLYNFCSEPQCIDGADPGNGMVMDDAGNLFGTTSEGGLNGMLSGTIFEITGLEHRKHKVLYNFCSLANCADGRLPAADVILNRKGYLVGGAGNVVFELKRPD